MTTATVKKTGKPSKKQLTSNVTAAEFGRVFFTVVMEPQGWARAGIATKDRQGRRLRVPRVYTQPEDERARRFIRRIARPFMPTTPLTGPVKLSVMAMFKMPDDWSDAEKEKMDGEWYTEKPDDDNIGKLIRDALNGLLYVDDRQVCGGGGVEKVWTRGESGVMIMAWSLGKRIRDLDC